MQSHIVSSLDVCLKDDGFSFDELVYRLEELFDKQAFPSLLCEILMLYDEMLRMLVVKGGKLPVKCECGNGSCFVLDGCRPRNIKTRIGEVRLPTVKRVKCKHCGKSFAPMLRAIGLDDYQTKTHGLEKLVLEQCAETSYRRAAHNVKDMTAVSVSHATFRNWVIDTDAADIKVPEETIGSVPGALFADGTKFKGIDAKGRAERAEIRVLLGVRASGSTFPIGVWSGGETWEEIAATLDERKVVFPEGTVLVCDGERHLAESLSRFATYQQRCVFHIPRETYFAAWADGARQKDIGPIQDKLKSVLAIELPKEDYELVPEDKKREIEQQVATAEKEVLKLIGEVKSKGFSRAAAYIENARAYMFNYVRRWLALGIHCPKASSIIERTMREIGRRIKKLGYNWKAKGVGQISKILLKIFSNRDEWDAYWKEKMSMNQSVLLSFMLDKQLTR